MKKLLKIVLVIFVVALGIIQFFRPSFSNPPLVPGQPVEESVAVPAEVQMLLSRSCNDCHSNKSVYPWYAQVAPFSWLLADHIKDGRNELNFSEWNTYSSRKKSKKLEEICEQLGQGEMPLPSYVWIHRDAALDASQRKLICDWATEVRGSLPTE